MGSRMFGRHQLVATSIQWQQFQHGVETWILWRCVCGCGRKRVEKISGRWSLDQLGVQLHQEKDSKS